jgi:hypothetical protein
VISRPETEVIVAINSEEFSIPLIGVTLAIAEPEKLIAHTTNNRKIRRDLFMFFDTLIRLKMSIKTD